MSASCTPFAPLTLRKGVGATRQVFCFPPGGGSPATYAAWARCAPADWNLFAMPTPGWLSLTQELRSDWSSTVSQMADAIAAQLDQMPKAFFGHCLGAATAIAVAGELVERGAPVPALLGVSACPSRGGREMFSSLEGVPEDDLIARIVELGMVSAAILSNPELRATAQRMFRVDMRFAAGCNYQHRLPLDIPVTTFAGAQDRLVSVADMLSWGEQTSRFLGTRTYDGGHTYPSTHAAQIVADFSIDIQRCIDGEGDPR